VEAKKGAGTAAPRLAGAGRWILEVETAGVHARLVAQVPTAPSGTLPPPKAVAAYQMPIPSTPVPGKPNAVTPWFAGAGLVWFCDEMAGFVVAGYWNLCCMLTARQVQYSAALAA